VRPRKDKRGVDLISDALEFDSARTFAETSQNFGCGAPGGEVMKERGTDATHVVEAAKSLLAVQVS
jgi:hypothetical protein